MKVIFEDKGPKRIKISDHPVGTVFSFDEKVFIKTEYIPGQPVFIELPSGFRVNPELHRDIDYGSVEILDAVLTVSKQ